MTAKPKRAEAISPTPAAEYPGAGFLAQCRRALTAHYQRKHKDLKPDAIQDLVVRQIVFIFRISAARAKGVPEKPLLRVVSKKKGGK